jgi:two-component system chemotaxis response regulator CheB
MKEKEQKIKILIVDDSFFMRSLLKSLLTQHPEFEVVGTAKNGIEAIRMAEELKPDVISMDINMPLMNGIEATKAILKHAGPVPTVVMFSAYAREGAEETFECLRAGAVDYIMKPLAELPMNLNDVEEEIISKLRAAASAKVHSFKDIQKEEAGVYKEVETKKAPSAQRIVIIGSSTGGPPLVENILMALPSDIKASFIVVQHMPKFFTESFARRLNNVTQIPVKEAEDRDAVTEGKVYVSPGNFYMNFVKAPMFNPGEVGLSVFLTPEIQHAGLQSIDMAMSAISKVFKGEVISIILTGMGQDGLEGSAAVKSHGGYVIAQSPETAVVDSMPRAIIENGLADEVLSPEKIIKRIIELCQ